MIVQVTNAEKQQNRGIIVMKWLIALLTTVMWWESAVATIDITVKTPECVVFASDSRTTRTSTAVATDTYEKIAKVTKYVMVQTAGTAFPGNKNLTTTIQDFRWKYGLPQNSELDIDSVIFLFRAFIRDQKAQDVNYSGLHLGFAGPNSEGHLQYYEYLPHSDTIICHDGYTSYAVYARGVTNVFSRVFKGIDRELGEEFGDSLDVIHAPDDSLRKPYDSLTTLIQLPDDSLTANDRWKRDSLLDVLSDSLATFDIRRNCATDAKDLFRRVTGKYNTVGPAQVRQWSKRDAIDYAYMLVHTTILVDRVHGGRFRKGSTDVNPKTGGRILMCMVTRDGVEWIIGPDYTITE